MIDELADAEMLAYYENQREYNGICVIEDRTERVLSSQNSMCKHYCDMEFISRYDIYTSKLSPHVGALSTQY